LSRELFPRILRLSSDALVPCARVACVVVAARACDLVFLDLQTADSDKLVRISFLDVATAASESTPVHAPYVLRTRSLPNARMHGIESAYSRNAGDCTVAHLSSPNFELNRMRLSVPSLISLLGSKKARENSCLITEIAFFVTDSFLGFSHSYHLRVWLSFVVRLIARIYLVLLLDQQQSRQEIAGNVKVLKFMDRR